MKRTALVACAAAALLVAACGGRTEENAQTNTVGDVLFDRDSRPAPALVTGCLTAADGQYVLTSLNPDAATATTDTYQLVAATDDDLRQYIGREVRVAGEADAPRLAEVREQSPPAVGTTGAESQGVEPGVTTQQTTRFEVRRLAVSSVTPTGNECPAAPAGR